MAKIKRFGVIKTAGFLGLYGVFIGLIFGIILLIYTQVLKTVLSGSGDLGATSMMGLLGIGGWLAVIVAPIIYGIIFFLIGLIFTPIMNLILKIINGLDWDIEMQNTVPQQQVVVPQQSPRYPQNYQR